MKVKYNINDDELYCVECKSRIRIGEKFIVLKEEIYGDEIIEKEYHPECVPEMENDD